MAERSASPASELESASDPSAGPVEAATAELRAGNAVLLSQTASGTAHLVAAAEHVSEAALELMSRRGQGVLSAAMTAATMERLGLTGVSTSAQDGRLYAAPVDRVGHNRPDSVSDRVATLRALASPAAQADWLISPGHVFPVEADAQGTLAAGQTPEAAFDLASMAKAHGVGIYINLPDSQGRDPERLHRELADELGVRMVTTRDVIVERERASQAARRVVKAAIPTRDGDLTAIGYRSERAAGDCVAFVHGDPTASRIPVYVHSRCPISDVFGGLGCGCGERLNSALARVREAGSGIVLYSSWGSTAHLGHMFDPPDPPDYPGRIVRPSRERSIAAVLRDLGVGSIDLDANEPLDLRLLSALGVEVASCAATEAER